MTDSLFRTVATAVHAKLGEILTLEGRKTPDLVFGMRGFKESDPAVRISWSQPGGRYGAEQPNLNQGDNPPEFPLGAWRALAVLRLWHSSEEEVQHVRDRLVMATRDVGVYSKLFHWAEASYEFPSEQLGEQLQNGVHIIRVMLPMDLPIASEPDGRVETVVITDTQVRTGIENPVDEPESATAYEVNDWVTPKVTSES